eukprot:scaffold107070_cov72-Phaeocystis_antarctica.AAC.2
MSRSNWARSHGGPDLLGVTRSIAAVGAPALPCTPTKTSSHTLNSVTRHTPRHQLVDGAGRPSSSSGGGGGHLARVALRPAVACGGSASSFSLRLSEASSSPNMGWCRWPEKTARGGPAGLGGVGALAAGASLGGAARCASRAFLSTAAGTLATKGAMSRGSPVLSSAMAAAAAAAEPCARGGAAI